MNQLKRHHEYVQHDLEMTLFFELIFGEETEFYQTLLNEDLIDETFGYQFVLEPTYCFQLLQVQRNIQIS